MMPSTTHWKVAVAASLFAAVAFSQTTPVVRLQNLAHTTESLDKTVPFYRDVLGLPVNGTRDPLAQQPQKLDAALRDAPGRASVIDEKIEPSFNLGSDFAGPILYSGFIRDVAMAEDDGPAGRLPEVRDFLR